MRRALSLTALILLALPAAALAARPRVRLSACDPGGRTATFTAVMRAVPGAERMQLRFRLRVRPAGGSWARVAAPNGGGGWHSASPGRARYVYDQRVTGLQPGAVRVA